MTEHKCLMSIVLTAIAAVAGGALAWRAATVAGGQAITELQASDVNCRMIGYNAIVTQIQLGCCLCVLAFRLSCKQLGRVPWHTTAACTCHDAVTCQA